jgi:osmotically inducible lipoprotein OsmB
MYRALKIVSVVALLAAAPVVALAGTLEGVAIGAGTGAVIAGPPGAVVGGVVGAVTGGPNIVTHRGRYSCWRDHHGYRHCR